MLKNIQLKSNDLGSIEINDSNVNESMQVILRLTNSGDLSANRAGVSDREIYNAFTHHMEALADKRDAGQLLDGERYAFVIDKDSIDSKASGIFTSSITGETNFHEESSHRNGKPNVAFVFQLDQHHTEEDTYYAKVLHVSSCTVFTPQLGTELVNRNEVFDKLFDSELEVANNKKSLSVEDHLDNSEELRENFRRCFGLDRDEDKHLETNENDRDYEYEAMSL